MNTRYAVINTANTQVSSVQNYSGQDFSGFKSDYESHHSGFTLVDLGSSTFPAGQGWKQDNTGTYPKDGPKGISDILPNIIRLIESKTSQIEYQGTVTFQGHAFPKDHDTRDDVVLLASSCLASSDIASELLPLRVNAIDGAEIVISNVADAKSFALAMLSPLKSIYAGQADQIAAVQAMTTITQLIQYIDPR